MSKINDIKLDLLENGLDFIDNSIDPILNVKNQHELKYSILHLSAGIELILKEILKNEHWSFIFEDINKANKKGLESGDFISVSFETIIKRLENIAEMEIPKESISLIRDIRKRRNKIEHFILEENEEAIKSIVSMVLHSIFEIINEYIDFNSCSEKAKEMFNILKAKSLKFKEYTSVKFTNIIPEIECLEKEGVRIITCPECLQKAFPLDEDYTCLFCGYTDTSENVLDAYVEKIMRICIIADIMDGGDSPICECQECGHDTFIFINNEDVNKKYICFNKFCLNEVDEEEISYCNDCGRLYHGTPIDGIDLCPDCIQSRIHE